MPKEKETGRTITARLDAATESDLALLEEHYRAGTSVVVRLAIAELARQLRRGTDEGKAAA